MDNSVTAPRFEKDGWCYRDRPQEGDARKIVSLEQDGMVWTGIRAYDFTNKRWVNNGEPITEKVCAWRDLPIPASGWWNRGILMFPPSLDDLAKTIMNEEPDYQPEPKLGWKP